MTRSFLICLCFLAASLTGSAQTTDSVYGPLTVKVKGDSVLVFRTVDIGSQFPGGARGWEKYLVVNLRYPEDCIKRNIQGAVVVQFIVTEKGKVTNVEVVQSVHSSLDREAMRLIKQSPDWVPAVQDGRKVNSYKKQPIVFKLL